MEHSFHNVRTTYAIAWEFTLLIQIMVEVSNYFKQNSHIKKNRDNALTITDYLIKHNYLNESRNLKVFFEYLRKIVDAKLSVKFKIVELEANIKAGNAAEKKLISLLHLEDIVLPKRALREILVSHPVFIFLDELDTGWDNSNEAKNYVNGLFDAVYSLSSIQNLNVFVSLRQDMYNNLLESLTNAEKIREDIEKLQWDKKNLKAVITKRILSSLTPEESAAIENHDVIDYVFDKNMLDYIIDHTLHRPREIIEFCNKSLEEYINTYNLHYDPTKKISKEIIDTILPEFSNNRILDICKEYQFEFPHIKEILFAFEHGQEYYSKKEFVRILENGVLKLMEKYGEADWIKQVDMNSTEIMEILFRIGFIKIFIPSEENYFAAYETSILDFDTIEKVKINDVFVTALKCQKHHLHNN
jgi:ribosomal protein L17